MRKVNTWMIITIILVIVIVGLLFGKQITGMFIVLTPEDIANKAMDYVNENLVAPNTTATFLSVKEFNSLYNVSFSYQDQNLSMYVTRDGSYVFLSQPLNIGEKLPQPETPKQTIGNFLVDEKSDVCKEDDKPIVYFFGSQTCPHCMWEHPIIKNITEKFKNQTSFHENIDTENDNEIFLKYSPRGYIPLILIGCKYYRVGSGEEFGEENEAKILEALICSLTNNKPLSVCAEVEDIINQVG
jgi:thiol-disulfide isomerase/thioredoxin